ncbi:hypothetical protein Esi_0152_0042 [Ectocarpus siliculosus]|uniref:Uncharacterized protein n=1 Tax=Ectocarpus siliculosus TaxID=2880 RepID=D8LFX1_ECTSI|nr:hypothetical protein Esi_0152_0042 [Ectocarpus siliculosus]|eukprot:CBN78870.1 hypothetical protein Esi_0152_0042 [Ectocarpus siliculosus]
MDGMDWPSFPTRFLEDSAEDWGRLPTEEGDGEGEEALLAQLEEAFASDRGGDQDHAKALGTIQAFLSTRRVRLIEDLLVLSASLGDSGGGEGGGGADAAAATIPPHRAGGGPLSSAADLRRELAFALDNTPKPSPATGGARNRGVGGVLLSDDGPAAVALRAAAGVSREAFFAEWAERFGTLLVPLGGGGEAGDGGDGGRARKDDREIQAARDVERDMLMVNGVLVKGSEGYPVVVGKVKRELARLAEPVAGADTAVVGAPMASAGPPSGGASGGGGRGAVQARQSMPQGERTGLPLRPPRQLQDFSKLVLKAANR